MENQNYLKEVFTFISGLTAADYKFLNLMIVKTYILSEMIRRGIKFEELLQFGSPEGARVFQILMASWLNLYQINSFFTRLANTSRNISFDDVIIGIVRQHDS